jgi:hypothetical protein
MCALLPDTPLLHTPLYLIFGHGAPTKSLTLMLIGFVSRWHVEEKNLLRDNKKFWSYKNMYTKDWNAHKRIKLAKRNFAHRFLIMKSSHGNEVCVLS